MTSDQETTPFEPVLLNLADSEDYAIVVSALEEYAASQSWEAENEQEGIRHNGLPESSSEEGHYREQAERARRIMADIERQLDANGAARRAIKGMGE